MRRALLIILALVVAGLLAAYLLSHRETRTLDAQARAATGGDFIQLPVGTTHYELTGPADGPVVVLVHGGTIPMWTWDQQVPALTQAGFRVLRYDQLGRGFSDRPRADYSRALYLTQLEQLLDGLQLDGRVNLVGLSFGAALSASYASSHPERVNRVLLLAPIVHHAEGKLLFHLAKIPGFGEWYVRVVSVPGALSRAQAFFPRERAEEMTRLFDQQTRTQGFEDALLSFARGDALEDYTPAYQATSKLHARVLLGAQDSEMPPHHAQLLEETFGADFARIEGGGHGMHEQLSQQINAQMLEFLAP